MAWKRSKFRFGNHHKSRLNAISKRMLFTWCMLGSLIIFYSPDKLTSQLQLTYASLFRWPLKVGKNYSLSMPIKQPIGNWSSSNEVSLKNQVADLQEALKQAYKKMESVSGLREYLPLERAGFRQAGVTTTTISSNRSGLIIDRGSDDQVAVNQYVFAQNSIIGTISEVANSSARVRLLTDPDSKIGVKIGSLDVKRTMVGTGNKSAQVLDMQTTHKVNIGDNVYAVEKGGFFDSPMIVGTVTKCQRSNKEPTVLDITVHPACDIEKLENVIVIIPKK
jgi:rod shape-determining protein MreC